MKRIGVLWISIMLTFGSVFLVIPAGEDIQDKVAGSEEFTYVPHDPIQINSKADFNGEPGMRGKADILVSSLNVPSRNHRWRLDETAGSIAYDSVGDDHGTINGATINQTGKVGTSYWFDGSSDYVDIDDNDTIDFKAGDDLYIFAWINTTSTNGVFLSKREVPGDAHGYMMQVANGKFGAYIDLGPTGAYIEGTANIADGQWHRVGMIRTGNILEAFVDGASIGTKNTAGGDISNGNPLLLGVEHDYSQYYTGYIDDVIINADFPPVADAGPDQTVSQHTLVIFDGSASTDDVGITNYWWNFTDVGPQSLIGVIQSHTFHNEGTYIVTLTVMDTLGATNSNIMEVNVTDGDPPVADAGPDQVAAPTNIVTFDGTASYDPGHLGEPIIDGIVNWTWAFDDGTGPVTLWGPNPTHQFDVPGTYPVTLTVMDNAPVITGGPYANNDTMNVKVVDTFEVDISSAALCNDWIFMSFPNKDVGHPFTIIVDVFDSGAGFVQWDIIRGWDNVNKIWMTSAKFWPPSLNTFDYVDNTMGFWLHISDYGDGVITIPGDLALQNDQVIIPLKAGWNLVGYPFPNQQEMFNTFGILGSRDRPIEVYDPTDPYGYRTADIMIDWHMPGGGYWVHLTFDEDLWMWCP